MKIDFYPKDDEVAEKIRKKSNVIFMLLPKKYNQELAENAVNTEIDFIGEENTCNILIINDKLLVLGGLGYKQHITKDKIKKILGEMIKTYEFEDDIARGKSVLMIYSTDLKETYIDSIKEIMYELNGTYKYTEKTAKNLYRHIFIAN
jgi:hypothetical protein